MKGFLTIVAVIIIVIFSVIGVLATRLMTTDALSTTHELGAQQALYLAESGLQASIHALANPIFTNQLTCAAINGNAALTNNTLTGAKGPFTVTSVGPQAPTVSTLNGALSVNATSITLNNASTYAASGRIMIDRELINYIGKSGNTLLNARRGADNTIATAHLNNTAVAQYQCTLTSKAGVPTLNPSGDTTGGMRTLQAVIQLAEGWAVGNNTGLTQNFMHWNRPNELQWTDAGVNVGNRKDMFSVFLISNADGWSVGQDGVFLKWDGNNWSNVESNDNKNYNSVFCNATNDCWAVGNAKSFDYWNGGVWTVQSSTISTLQNTKYTAVYCNASNDCWAVGNKSGGDVFVHWNGTNWTQDSSDPTPRRDLNDVTCINSTDCWAVGNNAGFVHWNGVNWATADTSALQSVHYNGIACPASNDCWAVGNRNNGTGVIARWNGTSWSDASTGPDQNYNRGRCRASNNCWIVGNSGVTVHWDGTSWAEITNPLGVTLNDISFVGPDQRPMAAWQEVFP